MDEQQGGVRREEMGQVITYQNDFYGWLTATSRLIREGRFSEVDAAHVAEELEGMGRAEKREMINRLTVLLTHLLKWQYQPARRSRSWQNTLAVQRSDLCDLLEDSPSLQYEIAAALPKAYAKALLLVEEETGLEVGSLPAASPYSFDQIADSGFLPE
jgi:hypothetical protein